MIRNLDMLCARVLKAKYFPNTSILNASAMPGISYTWRSILRGVKLIKEGLCGELEIVHLLICGQTHGWVEMMQDFRSLQGDSVCLLR
jgi:hypothetical protein